MTNRNREIAIKRLKSYTPEDIRLSGLPDPQLHHTNVSDTVLAMWEQDFYHKIAQDTEYWAERDRIRNESEPTNDQITTPTPPTPQPQLRPLFTWARGLVNILSLITQPILRTLTKGDYHGKPHTTPQGHHARRLPSNLIIGYHVRHHRRATSRGGKGGA